jgi:3-hydroxybutyryl-CoA dehydratase
VSRQAPVLDVGSELPVVEKTITQEAINRYAAVSGDGNPLHTDPEYAAGTRFGGPIAHGMLVLAYVSECLTAAFGQRWLSTGRLKARFRGPARPGDTVTVSGRVARRDGTRVACQLEARSQAGEPLITADAEVEV